MSIYQLALLVGNDVFDLLHQLQFCGTLSASVQERAVLVTTVGVAPGLAALRLAGGLAVRGLPGYIGQARSQK